MNILNDIAIAAPEALLLAAGLIGVLIGSVLKTGFSGLSRLFGALALAAAAMLSAFQVGSDPVFAFNDLYRVTPFLAFTKTVAFGVAAVALLMSGGYLGRENMNRFEYAMLIVLGAAGMGVMLSAANLMTLYMGIETLSLSSYVLAAFNRESRRSAEAGLKYFVLGALASGLLLYGAALIYGYTGSAQFSEIAAADKNIGLTFGMVLLLIGLGFKASAAPFHIWTPDVYEGAPTPVVAYFATAPKIAAVVVFANVAFTLFGAFEDSWRIIVAIMAALSMLVGAFGGLNQNNIKRLLAYSSIANVGFAFMAIASGEIYGAGPALTYMSIYVLTTLGVFGVVLAMRRREGMVEDISDLNGLSQRKPGVAIALTALIFSIAGIPPLAGFMGKWLVFEAAINAELYWLVGVGIVSSVISLGYYLRIIWAVWAKEAAEPFESLDGVVRLSVYGAAVLAFPVLFIWIGWLNNLATSASPG